VQALDDVLAELHRARSQLMAEIRDSDDVTNARVDALIAKKAKT
jgi:hypothetical protein